MVDDFDEEGRPASSLGKRLLQAVNNLWVQVNNLGKIADHHSVEIETMKRELAQIKGQVHGLRVSRGKAVAAKKRLEGKLEDIGQILN